jgi:hypothetical protein
VGFQAGAYERILDSAPFELRLLEINLSSILCPLDCVFVVQFPLKHPLTLVLRSLALHVEDVYDEEMCSDAYDAGHYRIERPIPSVCPYTDTDI